MYTELDTLWQAGVAPRGVPAASLKPASARLSGHRIAAPRFSPSPIKESRGRPYLQFVYALIESQAAGVRFVDVRTFCPGLRLSALPDSAPADPVATDLNFSGTHHDAWRDAKLIVKWYLI